jgi:O-antigen/teichoic acid export membrane protein
MKVLVQNIYASSKFAKVREWSSLITITASTQVIVQVLGFICGIIIIRLLSTEEYAFYTLANTMLGTMVMLADSGITNGLMAEGGKVWQNKKRLGVILITGMCLRKKFGIYSLIVTTPILAYLLLNHGAGWYTSCLIMIAVIPAFYASLSDSFLEIAPKLHQDIKPLQKNHIVVSVTRLVLSALSIYLLPFTFIALLANGISRMYGNYKLIKISSMYASDTEAPDLAIEKRVMKSVKRTLPNVIYYCISGQIIIWLVSFLGTTSSISQIGALGRVNVIFTFFTVLFTTLVIPRFSRMKNEKYILLRPFILSQLSVVLINVFLLVVVWAFSEQLLWVLGNNYRGLNYELLLFSISSGLGFMIGVCSQLTVSRGWYMSPIFMIGVNICSTVISIKLFDISSLIGVLYLSIMTSITAYLLVLAYALLSIFKVKEQPSSSLINEF